MTLNFSGFAWTLPGVIFGRTERLWTTIMHCTCVKFHHLRTPHFPIYLDLCIPRVSPNLHLISMRLLGCFQIVCPEILKDNNRSALRRPNTQTTLTTTAWLYLSCSSNSVALLYSYPPSVPRRHASLQRHKELATVHRFMFVVCCMQPVRFPVSQCLAPFDTLLARKCFLFMFCRLFPCPTSAPSRWCETKHTSIHNICCGFLNS